MQPIVPEMESRDSACVRGAGIHIFGSWCGRRTHGTRGYHPVPGSRRLARTSGDHIEQSPRMDAQAKSIPCHHLSFGDGIARTHAALSRRSHNQIRPSSGQTRNNHRSTLIRHNCHTGGTPGTEPKVFKISPYGSRLLCLPRTAGHVKQKQLPVAQIAKRLVTKRISALC
jgi:hypothetical protein